MRKTLMLVTVLALLAGSITVVAQTAYDMQGPPKVLNIAREYVKAGKNFVHDQHEAAWLQALKKAGYTGYTLTLTSVTGEPEEWFMAGYNSFAAWEKDSQNFEHSAALRNVMAEYSLKDADYINNYRTVVAMYRPDLSYKTDFKLGEYKYFNVATVRYRMGSGPEETCKILTDAVKKANLEWRWEAYEVHSGAPVNTFIFLIPLKSAAEWDEPPNQAFVQALKEGKWDEALGKTTTNVEYRLFSFNPRLSNVPESVSSLDPAFWHPKPVVAKGETVKKATPAAQKETKPEKKP